MAVIKKKQAQKAQKGGLDLGSYSLCPPFPLSKKQTNKNGLIVQSWRQSIVRK